MKSKKNKDITPAVAEPQTLYGLMLSAITGMKIGDHKTIPLPDKLTSFRKYLGDVAGKRHLKFITRVQGDKLLIIRTEYFELQRDWAK